MADISAAAGLARDKPCHCPWILMCRNTFGKSWVWENGFDPRPGGRPEDLVRRVPRYWHSHSDAVAGGYCGGQRFGLSRKAEDELNCIEYGVVEADVWPLFKGIKLGISDL
jgi:hypothetical protein